MKRTNYNILIFLIGIALGAAVDCNRVAEAAGLLIADGGLGGKLKIIEHDVKVTINNGVAVTEVTQVFKNLEKRQVEALYTFPVPKDASVSNFSMWIGGREMIGEVLEKKRAREIYESYKQQRRDPGLLEQVDYRTFEMRIFPIGPDAEQKVKVTYYQELDYDNDWATYVYPLATTTHGQMDTTVEGKFAIGFEVKSVIGVTQMLSPSHKGDVLIVKRDENHYEGTLEKRSGELANDVVLSFQTSRAVSGLDLITSKVAGDDGYFLLTLTAGKELEKMNTGSDYVFILDISGSMADDNKLDTSRGSVEAFITTLGTSDRFEVITFNREAKTLFNRLTAANEQTLTEVTGFFGKLQAKGGTLLRPALQVAYKYAEPGRPLNVVIMSDGITNQDESGILVEMIRSRPRDTRIFCVGVGNDINRPLLKRISGDAGGVAAFISNGDDFTRQASAFRRKLMHPVATELELQVDGLELYDIEPQKVSNLYHGMPIRIYGRYRGAGEGMVKLTGKVGEQPFTMAGSILFPETDKDNPEIERMWARAKMDRLQNESDNGPEQAIIDEIIRLGEAYSITSEYTSFIVLENDEEYKRWNIKRRNQLRVVRDRAGREKVRNSFAAIRDKVAENIGPEAAKNTVTSTAAVPELNQPLQGLPAPLANQQPVVAKRMPQRRQSLDMGLGGGAIDPFSALAAAGLAATGALSLRRKK
ncbi:MAG: VIT and VWA domain-containing protein [Desulfobulbaceae bacterium]|nr:VIT and VWA domain-containing protein [Desulfobulbaceae bacterium]